MVYMKADFPPPLEIGYPSRYAAGSEEGKVPRPATQAPAN